LEFRLTLVRIGQYKYLERLNTNGTNANQMSVLIHYGQTPDLMFRHQVDRQDVCAKSYELMVILKKGGYKLPAE
jgi:hypothetical protein